MNQKKDNYLKVAVLYSGYPNYFQSCIENQKQNVFSFFNEQSESVDIFGHFWKTHDSEIKFSTDYDLIENSNLFKKYRIDKQLASNKLNFKNYKADDLFPSNINSLLSQAFSWKEAWKIMTSYENQINKKYDLVIRIRPDEYFKSLVKLHKEISMDSIYFKDMFLHLNFGLNDHFAFGHRDLMIHYMNLYDEIYNLIDRGCPVNLELLLGFELRIIKNIKVEKINLEFDLFRRLFN